MVVGLCIQSPAYRRNKTAIVHVQLWHLDPVWLEISQQLALPLWTSWGKRQNTDSLVPLLWGLISSCLAEPKHSPFMLHNTPRPLGEFSRGKKNYTHTHTHTQTQNPGVPPLSHCHDHLPKVIVRTDPSSYRRALSRELGSKCVFRKCWLLSWLLSLYHRHYYYRI